jgi:hypothetical protein
MIDTENAIKLARRVKNIRIACHNDFVRLFKRKKLDQNKDIRATSIIRFTRLLIGLNVSFSHAIYVDHKKIFKDIRIPIYEDKTSIDAFMLQNEIFLKLGFTSSLFFIMEGVLNTYLKYIDIQSYKKTKGIKNICKRLLEELGWKDANYYSSIFNFLRLIRNTLHNNGIHIPTNKSDKNISPITYKGKDYIFEENKRLEFVSWDLLLDLTEDMKNLLFLIASDDVINQSDDLIYDPLAI